MNFFWAVVFTWLALMFVAVDVLIISSWSLVLGALTCAIFSGFYWGSWQVAREQSRGNDSS